MSRYLFFTIGILIICAGGARTQDTIPSSLKKIVLNGQVGDLNISYEFDSLNFAELRFTIEALDSLINNQERVAAEEIYGHDLFGAFVTDSSMAKPSAKVSDNYVIGRGDVIAITIFGISQFEGKFEVDEQGFISPSDIPKVMVTGLKWKEVKKILQRRFSNYFRFKSDQFGASIISPRSVTVNVFGEVSKPGSYSIPATYTAFNALIIAHGPTNIGSVRNVKISDVHATRILDLYDLYNNPSKQFDLYLGENTTIQIPPAQKIVGIHGAVRRPLNYELNPSEGISDLIFFAGGLSSDALLENIQLTRFEGNKKIIIDLNQKDISENFMLKSGDKIFIKSIDSDVEDFVTIEGAVHIEGEFALNSTPDVRTLVDKARLKDDARLDVSYIARTKNNGSTELIKLNLENLENSAVNNLTLQSKDKLIISSLASFVDHSTISVNGSVREEIEYPFDSEAKIYLSQALFLAGGLAPDASDIGYIIRSKESNLKEKEYIEVNLRQAQNNEFGPDDIILKPWDQIKALANATYTDQSIVSTRGAVREPLSISYGESLQLKDLIILSGGLKEFASNKLTVVRLNLNQAAETHSFQVEIDDEYNVIAAPNNFSLMPHDVIIIRKISEFEHQQIVNIRGEVVNEGHYNIREDKIRLSDIIQQCGGLTSEAFAPGAYILRPQADSIGKINHVKIITDLTEVLRNLASPNNHILKAGDEIFIPKKESVVYINLKHTKAHDQTNSIRQIIGVKHAPGKSAKWYIEEFAGGFSENKDKSNVVVVYANGAMKRSKGTIFRKFPSPEIGSTISIKKNYLKQDDINTNTVKQPLLKKGVIINIDSKKGTAESAIQTDKS